jgi:hypothetical protein
MPDENDQDEPVIRADETAPARPAPDGESAMPRPLQEHLAQQLRSAYHTLEDKPAFLGDPAIPVEFEHHLQRLEAVERVRRTEKVRTQGIEAVKSALEDIVAGPLDLEEPDKKPQGGGA